MRTSSRVGTDASRRWTWWRWTLASCFACAASERRSWNGLPAIGVVYERPESEGRLKASWSLLARHTRTWSPGVYATYLEEEGEGTSSEGLQGHLKDLGLSWRSSHLQSYADVGPSGSAFRDLLMKAVRKRCDVVVLIDPSVVLTPRWLNPLVATLESDADIAAAGPIHNALGFRVGGGLAKPWTDRSPSRRGEDDQDAEAVESMARLAFLTLEDVIVKVPGLHESLVAVAGDVLQREHGQLQANEHGWSTVWAGVRTVLRTINGPGNDLVLVPRSYVEVPVLQSAEHSSDRIGEGRWSSDPPIESDANKLSLRLRRCRPLSKLRLKVASHSSSSLPPGKEFSVLFVLNKMTPRDHFELRGGWISIVQECLGLAAHGAHVRMAIPAWTAPYFEDGFPAAASTKLFLPFEAMTSKNMASELILRREAFDFVVATLFTSVPVVERICAMYPSSIKSYYVQDIETQFSPALKAVADASYTSMSDAFVFVKTNYLAEKLKGTYGIHPRLIPPTVDTNLFHPSNQTKKSSDPTMICAMVRVATPRRNPLKTFRILADTVRSHGSTVVNARAFGSSDEEIASMLEYAGDDHGIPEGMTMLGFLDRLSVANLFQECDIFLDFSSWQAFGRSGIECMAAGCVPILPLAGGCSAYATDRADSFLIDTSDVHQARRVIDEILDPNFDLDAMKVRAVQTAKRFSIHRSGSVTAKLFKEVLRKKQTLLSLNRPNRTLVC